MVVEQEILQPQVQVDQVAVAVQAQMAVLQLADKVLQAVMVRLILAVAVVALERLVQIQMAQLVAQEVLA
jgi:hypothetical protein